VGEAGPVRRAGLIHRARGSISLELALAVPALFLLLLLVMHAAVLARDALLVQSAAREGARVAATTVDDRLVRRAVVGSLDGRAAEVSVSERRVPGQLVRVEVRYRSAAGRMRPTLTARATSTVEPGIGVATPSGPPPGAP
jgi:Flp pilus assembly protein TadG